MMRAAIVTAGLVLNAASLAPAQQPVIVSVDSVTDADGLVTTRYAAPFYQSPRFGATLYLLNQCRAGSCADGGLRIEVTRGAPVSGPKARLLEELAKPGCWQALLTLPGRAERERLVGCFDGKVEGDLAFRGHSDLPADQMVLLMVATRVEFAVLYTDLYFTATKSLEAAAAALQAAVERVDPSAYEFDGLPDDVRQVLARRRGP